MKQSKGDGGSFGGGGRRFETEADRYPYKIAPFALSYAKDICVAQINTGKEVDLKTMLVVADSMYNWMKDRASGNQPAKQPAPRPQRKVEPKPEPKGNKVDEILNRNDLGHVIHDVPEEVLVSWYEEANGGEEMFLMRVKQEYKNYA